MNKLFHVLFLICLFLLGGCRTTPPRITDYQITINDSLYWKRTTGDSLIKIPTSMAQIVFIPTEMRDGEKKEEKSGQAKIQIVRKDSLIYVTATCDSLQMKINILEEELTKVKEEKQALQEEVKPIVNKWEWLFKGAALGVFLLICIIIYKRIK